MAPDRSEPSHLGPFSLGDWLVDPKACLLSRGETAVKLRAQLVDLLVCLARRAGNIVLKEEILAEVWPGQYIAESGLSRCIAELRQFLQDDPHQPRYIETITKRGYRIVAPVVWAVPATRDAVPGAAGVEPKSGIEGPEPDARTAVPPARRGRGWARRALGSVAVVLLAAAAVAVALLVRPPSRVLTGRESVLLADVSNATGDRVFDDTLRLALTVNLEQAPFLRILPQDAVQAAVARMGRAPGERVVGPPALEVCRREGAAVLLAASIAPLGSRYAIGIEAIECASGNAIGRALVEADSKERVLGALGQAAGRIRERLGESQDSLGRHSVPLERATTPSLEALKALTLGDDNRDHARLAEALTLYRQATELDPGFALAWARRGVVAINLGLTEEMIPALRRAYELRDRTSQPERFYIEAHFYRNVEGNPEKAIEIYQTWKRLYPGSVIPPNNLAAVLSGAMGRYDEALGEAREAVRLAPRSSIAHRNVVRAHLGAGRIAEARQAIAEAIGRGVDDRLMHRLLLNMALLDGDGAAVEREVRWASADPMTMLVTLRLRASAAMAAGRLREGRRLWLEALSVASQVGPASRVADTRLYQAEAEALLGDRRAAREAAEAAVAADSGPGTAARAALVLALAGERVRAAGILDSLTRQPLPEPGPLIVSLPSTRALVEAGQGHIDKAIALYQPIARYARGSDFELVPLGVGALLEVHARRPANAAAAFTDVIRLRAIEPASPWVAFARLGLARALRDSGDTSGSLAAYDDFLRAGREADPGAPLFEAARQERAAVAAR